MPKMRKPPPIPEKYEVQINPNTLALALESALKSATAPLYKEIGQLRQEVSRLREQQGALVEGFEQMQRNHIEQLRMLAERLRASFPEEERS